MEALMGSGGSFMTASQDESMDTRCRCCQDRASFASTPSKARRSGVCRSISAGLLLVLLSVSMTVTLMSLFSQKQICADAPSRTTTGPQPSFADGVIEKQMREEHPRALLTAPLRDITVENRLQWESSIGLAFCCGGFNYSDGYLLVPVAGYYNLMVQITYQYHSDSSDLTNRQVKLDYKVFIYRPSYRQDTLLVSAQDTVNCSVGQWSKSLHVSSFFYFEANSRLKVNSSYASLIVKKEDLTFFGVELSPR